MWQGISSCSYNLKYFYSTPALANSLSHSALAIMDGFSYIHIRESSGSVVECLIRDRGAAGASLTRVTALWSLSKTHLS